MYRLSEYTWDLISTHAGGKGSCMLAQTCQAGRRAAGRGRERTKSKDVEGHALAPDSALQTGVYSGPRRASLVGSSKAVGYDQIPRTGRKKTNGNNGRSQIFQGLGRPTASALCDTETMAEEGFGTHTSATTSRTPHKWNTLLGRSVSGHARTGGRQPWRHKRVLHSETILHSL